MSNLRQAAQQALEALIPLANAGCPNERECLTDEDHERAAAAAEALEQALAEPEQEPLPDKVLRGFFILTNTAEPLAEGWPGLERFARAIERAHGIGGEA